MHGVGGKILYIDLNTGEHHTSPLAERQLNQFFCGSGLGAALLHENVPKGADPLGPGNVVIISPGTLVGSPVPTASKTSFVTKSPLTGGFTESVMGGGIGVKLKFAGYDALVVHGCSKDPCFILIDDDKVEIRDASKIWGMDTYSAPEAMIRAASRRKIDRSFVVACIGPGGENLVRYAGVDSEHRQSGRGGVGAVLGSKKCKGIVVRGTKKLSMAEPGRLLEVSSNWHKTMVSSGDFEIDGKYGTGDFLEWMNSERGTFPTRNWQNSVYADRKKIDPYYWAPLIARKNKACYSCIKPCGHLVTIEDGKYNGVKIDGMEYELLYSLGSQIGNPDPEALARAHELVDRFGIDGISAGVSIGFAMECYEKGILSKDDCYGYELNFGNIDGALDMIEAIATRREGLGNILADGTRLASQQIGKGSETFAVQVKGQEPPAYDVRGIKGLGLGFMTSPRGACHLRSCAYALELTGKFWKYKGIDRFAIQDKGEIIANLENLMALYDALGICKFQRGFYLLENVPQLVKVVTGLDMTETELLMVGERVHTLKKLFNLREGFGRKDDTLPPRLTSEPIPEGAAKGSYIKPEEAETMLDEYYLYRGWDGEGVPTDEKLEELDLEDFKL